MAGRSVTSGGKARTDTHGSQTMASDASIRRRRHPPPPTTTATSTVATSPSATSSDIQSLSSNHDDHVATNENTEDDDRRHVTSKNIYQLCQHYDEYAWVVIFLTALSYLIAARSSGGSGSSGPSRGGLFSNLVAPYAIASTSVIVWESNENEKLIKSVFYIDENNSSPKENDKDENSSTLRLALQHGSQLEVVLSSDLDLDGNGLTHDVDECTASSGVDECNNNENKNKHNDYESNKVNLSPSRPYLSHLTSTTWVHDPDLGRGYLLVNDAGRSGRIWRWEVGGGPISIGRTLHMERSGCRSGLWLDHKKEDVRYDTKRTEAGICPENLKGDPAPSISVHRMTESNSSFLLGSASIAVEPSSGDGKKNLAVAEWGERRIVRLEEGTGARTPLVTLVPTEEDDCPYGNEGNMELNRGRKKMRRLYRPNHLTYTPTGDLLFSDSFVVNGSVDTVGAGEDAASNRRQVGVVYRKKGAVHIPPISVEQSRDAHGWIRTTGEKDEGEDDETEILFQCDGWIEGISLGLDHAILYVLATGDRTDQIGSTTKTVYKLRIGPIDIDIDDDDYEEDSEDDKDNDNTVKDDDVQLAVLYKTTSSDCTTNDVEREGRYSSTGSKLAVDMTGTLYLLSCPTSVALLSPQGQMIGVMGTDRARRTSRKYSQASQLTSIGFGGDGFLYITSVNELMRVKSRVGGLSVPVSIVPSP